MLDDQDYIEEIIDRLQIEGYEVRHVYIIEDALKIYEQFDLIICDVNLYNENGFDFFDKIKDIYTGKFIFHSGWDHSEEAKKRDIPFYMKSGVDYVKVVEEIF